MRSSRRYRLYPTPAQERLMRGHVHTCRAVWNLLLEQRQLAWKMNGVTLSSAGQDHDLRELRNDPEIAPWLKDTPAQVLQQVARDLDDAFRRFWAGQNGYPRYKHRARRGSFRMPQRVKVDRRSKRWALVGVWGVGRVRVRCHRALVGSVKSATLTWEPDGTWWISFGCEQRDRRPTCHRHDEGPIGTDLGCEVTLATSNGERHHFEPWTPGERERLRRLERQKARQRPGSKNMERTCRKIAALHARARRRRKDFAEQTSARLSKNHALIGFEDLRIESMVASARGTVEEPGRNVAQKAGLNRSIHERGWGMIVASTQAKAPRRGGRVMKVSPHHSSNECPSCGTVDPSQRVTRSRYECRRCGYRGHADVGAAMVILKRVLERNETQHSSRSIQHHRRTAGGAPVTARPGTHEPGGELGGKTPTVAQSPPVQSGGARKRESQTGHRTVRRTA